MQLPVKITYRGLEKSDQIDNLVLDYAARLERFCDHINRCDVAIEQTNHTHQKGNPYRCRIDVTVARGHELVADEKQMGNGTHQPLNKPTPTHVRRNNCSADVPPNSGQTREPIAFFGSVVTIVARVILD
jgi:hypothetical protein